MTADDAAQAMAAVALAGASVARAAVEVDRAKWTITALRTERDALAAEVDRCDGCGSSLSRCLRWHEKREGMGKCCPECKHPGEAAGWATLRAERDALAAENARLRASWESLRDTGARLLDRAEKAEAQVQAVEALCAKAEHGALRWEHPLPVPEWVPAIRAALATTEAGEES